ncbi:hypothetical protein CRG98_022518 [Punica granatum]|uniref:Uncharacterized protein n=1 Tax=Punica granatum TaxID=22663 RepID=A0A2I0JL57_PUNGR|nr:hypothetical protein CRG98_022518 [Punica granatum]
MGEPLPATPSPRSTTPRVSLPADDIDKGMGWPARAPPLPILGIPVGICENLISKMLIRIFVIKGKEAPASHPTSRIVVGSGVNSKTTRMRRPQALDLSRRHGDPTPTRHRRHCDLTSTIVAFQYPLKAEG